MFTVIIAEQSILDMFEEFRMFLNPLMNKSDVVYCAWKKNEDSIEKMLPSIYEKIAFRKEWRAIVVNNDNINTLNPFDFTQVKEKQFAVNEGDWAGYAERRSLKNACYRKAFDNPLTKLTSALCGTPVFNSVIEDKEVFRSIVSGETELYEFMLKNQLEVLDLSETAAWLDTYMRKNLSNYVPEDKVDNLINLVREADTKAIISEISPSNVVGFISLIGKNDPIYFDPYYTECMVENTMKAELFNSVSEEFSFKDKKPTEVICVSPRVFNTDLYKENSSWEKTDNSEYSNFCENNLYSDKLKFILFELLPADNKQYLFERIRMMCFLLILAGYRLPGGVVASGKVYKAEFQFDSAAIENTCTEYISKLKATDLLIKDHMKGAQEDVSEALDKETFEELFESDVDITIDSSEYNRSNLFTKMRDVGLASDCPKNEEKEWKEEYREITKRFAKYMKEPRRAVKAAVNNEFKPNSHIDDDRALRMTGNQSEDIADRLNLEEQLMVESTTNRLFNNAKYKEEIDKADEEVRASISQRMSKRKTLIVSSIALAAYLVGYLPLVFRNTDTEKSLICALLVTLAAFAVLAFAGVITLVIMRKKHLRTYDRFNSKMSGICSEIEDGLRDYSAYLGHACNVMRASSIMQIKESSASKEQRVLKYHELRVEEKTRSAYELFSKYIDCDSIDLQDVEPYLYNFSIMKEYDFDMPYKESNREIVYAQEGNMVTIPVDYVDSVIITREELYE